MRWRHCAGALGLSRAFDEVYACSSGAINAAYFVAGQAAYSVSIYYDEVNNRNFINPLRLNNILNMDFLFDEVIKRTAARRRAGSRRRRSFVSRSPMPIPARDF